MAVLELDNVSAGYGPITILDRLSLQVDGAETVAILGANGSGKSTALKTVMGLTRVFDGRVLFEDSDVTALPGHRRAGLGIGYVPQTQNVFADLTVADNLRMGAYLHPDALAAETETIFALFPRLKERYRASAGSLSGGERRMLAIGMALLLKPRLLLLDEPSSDLSPAMVEAVFAAIREIRQRLEIPILLVEQNVNEALAIAGRVCVLVRGCAALDEPVAAFDTARLHDLFLGGSVVAE